MQFPSETNLNLLNLWSPPSVPTGAVLKLGGSMSLDNSELSSVPIVTAPLGLLYSAVVPQPRRPLMVRAALLRRSCDGVAAATEHGAAQTSSVTPILRAARS